MRFHYYPIQSTAECGIADVASMIMEVGEDFWKEFNRKLENCTTQVICRSKEQDNNPKTHFRWLGPVVPFELCVSEGPPSSTPLLATCLLRAVREKLGSGEASILKGRSE